jgi:cytochrome P450
MIDLETADYFKDPALIHDPFPYFEHIRAKGPVVADPRNNAVLVTGYEEALAVYHDEERFSSVNAISGPYPPLPFTPDANDIGPQLEKHRDQMAFNDWIATKDPPTHTALRGLLMGLITPARVKRNEEYMWRAADRQIDEFIKRGSFEAITDYCRPFTVMVIADLLGVPEEDHKAFCDDYPALPTQIEGDDLPVNPFDFLTETFTKYIKDRRAEPRNDYLNHVAHAKLPDGTLPSLIDAVNTAVFLFSAGQDTSARLIAGALRAMGERPELQKKLREERNLIPIYLEEVLRLDPPVKCSFRMARVPAKVGNVDVTPGTTVALLVGAVNRDPRRFERPSEILFDRKSSRDHTSFGRGIHTCAGAPLARNEALVTFQRLFDRTTDIRISEAKHGPAGARNFSYDPTYLLRGLQALHLEITPKDGASSRAA